MLGMARKHSPVECGRTVDVSQGTPTTHTPLPPSLSLSLSFPPSLGHPMNVIIPPSSSIYLYGACNFSCRYCKCFTNVLQVIQHVHVYLHSNMCFLIYN